MKRVITKIGDVFSVTLDDSKKYFQLIAFDITQLNSDVIRVFKQKYPIEVNPKLTEIVNGEVEFYAHCVTSFGIKLGLWEKVGKIDDIGSTNHILFRGTSDIGQSVGVEPIKLSSNWHVWKIGDDRFTEVGKLEGDNRKAYVGLVFSPLSIVHMVKTGKIRGFYPDFE